MAQPKWIIFTHTQEISGIILPSIVSKIRATLDCVCVWDVHAEWPPFSALPGI